MGNSHGEHQMGGMDISEHRQTYAGFMKATKYSSIAIAILLALMAFFLVHRGGH